MITNQEAIKIIEDKVRWLPTCPDIVREALDVAISALQQPERMRAKWIATASLQEGQITWRDYKCSNCSHHREKPMNFCEVCGAKMER